MSDLPCPHARYWSALPCKPCREALAAAEQATNREWFDRTGHCGGCGQPGHYCTCTERRPCGCRELHPMGSGLDPDALDQFAIPVDDNQGGLFDV